MNEPKPYTAFLEEARADPEASTLLSMTITIGRALVASKHQGGCLGLIDHLIDPKTRTEALKDAQKALVGR